MKIWPLLTALSALGLSSCQTVSGWANSVGDHMPVIGNRCDNWQCFTSSGQQASEMKKEQVEQPAGVTTARTPVNQPQTAPAMPDPSPSPAAAKTLTPWDMYPTPPAN